MDTPTSKLVWKLNQVNDMTVNQKCCELFITVIHMQDGSVESACVKYVFLSKYYSGPVLLYPPNKLPLMSSKPGKIALLLLYTRQIWAEMMGLILDLAQ